MQNKQVFQNYKQMTKQEAIKNNMEVIHLENLLVEFAINKNNNVKKDSQTDSN